LQVLVTHAVMPLSPPPPKPSAEARHAAAPRRHTRRVSDPVRVLVYGGIGSEACDTYRLGLYVERLAGAGVRIEPWTPPLLHPPAYSGRWWDAIRDGVAAVSLDALAEADVVLFSRWSNTRPACTECGLECGSPDGLERHTRETGHASLGVDPLLRLVATGLLANPAFRSKCAVVYDLDDDLFHQPSWAGHAAGLARELDLVELFIRTADLVTVATPALAHRLAPLNGHVQIVRNAVEPAWYRAPASEASTADHELAGSTETRVVFYGADVRRRDYEVCRAAVDRAAGEGASGGRPMRRIWLGSDSASVRRLVDEALPYQGSVPKFAAALAATRADIGLAPLEESEFAHTKSELHWLELSLVGAATVASRLDEEQGPYSMIRHRVDGMLVRGKAEWYRALMDLAGSVALRDDIAGRASERVLAEYQVRDRATEWAAAYRWAASHSGIGLARFRG
jgi:hypothetical protein